MSLTKGIDVSAWQDRNDTPQKINWEKVVDQGVKFAFIRCCNGFTPDEDFAYNWAEAKRVGILRGAYLFHDYRTSPSGQAKFFADRLRDDPGELPPVLDVEKYWKPYPTRSGWLSAINTMAATLNNEGHPRVIFYSNPDTILYTLSPIPSELTRLPLWIAHYGATAPKASAVVPWGTWTFWQYSCKGDGAAFGMESKDLDLNWFNGDITALYAFAGITSEPETEPEPDDAEKLARLWKAHPELW